jgi:hypothetical protein
MSQTAGLASGWDKYATRAAPELCRTSAAALIGCGKYGMHALKPVTHNNAQASLMQFPTS